LPSYQVAIVGGGIVGLATARALAAPARGSVVVLEAESRLASHQTGHNSGVVHSGLYYSPGSEKARHCVAGRTELVRYCQERGLPHEICGKVVVATSTAELPRLHDLAERGRANGLAGLELLSLDGLRRVEPHAAGVAALRVPETGIVDFVATAESLAQDLRAAGGVIRVDARLRQVIRHGATFRIVTPAETLEARCIVGCAGLHADRVARLCGLRPGLRIIPFRGEYARLRPEREHLVRHLIYPVPDPRFPFLGVHFTRRIGGGIDAGPNALLAWARHGYARGAWSARDALDTLGYVGFWRLLRRVARTGLGEMARAASRKAFAAALARLVPEIGPDDIVPAGSGVRAQAVTPDGALVDDFRIVEAEHMLHVLNAPSPAATAALSIGKQLAQLAADRFGLHGGRG
jgi:L-2-hydroxyglutarate oxidase